jgi:hypothetical protein
VGAARNAGVSTRLGQPLHGSPYDGRDLRTQRLDRHRDQCLFEASVPGVLNSVVASAARSRDELIAELARHPMFESARCYREPDLAAYEPPLLRNLLSTRRVLRRPEAPWGLAASDPAVERLMSLMKAGNATHVVILSHEPVDLLVPAVPVISADPATETALALVRRILASTPEAA